VDCKALSIYCTHFSRKIKIATMRIFKSKLKFLSNTIQYMEIKIIEKPLTMIKTKTSKKTPSMHRTLTTQFSRIIHLRNYNIYLFIHSQFSPVTQTIHHKMIG
jgi:hypothetical protein